MNERVEPKLLEVPEDEKSIYTRLLEAGNLEAYKKRLSKAKLAALPFSNKFWLRKKQMIPVEDDFEIILMMAGRGWGKTRSGSAWVRQQLFVEGCSHGALVARTYSEAVGIVLKEASGIMNNFPPHLLPQWKPHERELYWEEHDKRCTVIYGNEPEQCRGYNFDFAWVDEGAKYRDLGELVDLLIAALRLKRVDGKQPPALFTTTPLPDPTLHQFQDWADAYDPDNIDESIPKVKVITGATHENKDNLGKATIRNLTARYGEGTRKYKQEVLGVLLRDIEGAIFRREMINYWMPTLQYRGTHKERDAHGKMVTRQTPATDAKGNQLIDWVETLNQFSTIGIGVDPSGARDDKSESDDIGIVIAGVLAGTEEFPHVVVLHDGTFKASPSEWGQRTVNLYGRFRSNVCVGEENFGGGMVEHTIKSAPGGDKVNYIDMRATRGKDIRAEEIAGFYEAGRVSHLHHIGPDGVPVLADLEDQMCHMTIKGYKGEGRSPDRADAMIWIVRYLLRDLEPEVTHSANFIRGSTMRSLGGRRR